MNVYLQIICVIGIHQSKMGCRKKKTFSKTWLTEVWFSMTIHALCWDVSYVLEYICKYVIQITQLAVIGQRDWAHPDQHLSGTYTSVDLMKRASIEISAIAAIAIGLPIRPSLLVSFRALSWFAHINIWFVSGTVFTPGWFALDWRFELEWQLDLLVSCHCS